MDIQKLAISIILPFIASLAGTITNVNGWYDLLTKPSFNPPDYLFGIVWTLLYLLMGIAFYLIWSSESRYKKPAIVIFLIQLIFNALWTLLFFGLHSILLAFVDIVILEGLIILTMYDFYKVDKKATYLLIPYLLWVTFALILNLALLLLN